MTKTETISNQLEVTIEDVTKVFKTHGIPLEKWGQEKAKTVKHLAQEIVDGETTLVIENGNMLRKVELVQVDVRFLTAGIEYVLKEDRQVFSNERVRRRNLTGVSEKTIPGENPLDSAKRAISEELQIDEPIEITYQGTEIFRSESPSYPGLTSEYKKHKMLAYLPETAFHAEGYSEEQGDKTTYFVWVVMESELDKEQA